ncbi:MAG: hypothetical protein GQ570_09495 [Helicobacteraceae bacterium]|nr:hypothetical protein [Helicobacteraceae bacterium]
MYKKIVITILIGLFSTLYACNSCGYKEGVMTYVADDRGYYPPSSKCAPVVTRKVCHPPVVKEYV